MSALGSLVVSLSLQYAEYTKGLSKSSADAQRFANDTKRSFDSFSSASKAAFASVGTQALGVGTAFLSATTAINTLKNSLNFADEINDIAKANEFNVGSVLKLSEALKLSGGESANASKLISSLTQSIDQAAQGTESTQKRFKDLGVTLNDIATLDGQQIFEKTLDGLSRIEDPVKRNAIAMDLFGKAVKGVDLQGLADSYLNNVQNFDDAEKAFNKIGNAFDRIDELSQKAKISLATNFAPVLEKVLSGIDSALFGYDNLIKKQAEFNRKNGSENGKYTFNAAPTLNDNTFAGLNLPESFRAGAQARREVINKAEEEAKKQAAKNALEAADRAKKNALALKDLQFEISQEQYAEERENREKSEKAERDAREKINKERLDAEEEFRKIVEEADRADYEGQAERIQRNYDEQMRLEEKLQEQRQRNADDLNRSLTDALLRGFESGKSFGKNFIDTLKNMFQSLVLRPTISAILAPVSGGLAGIFSGSANASTGSSGNIFGDIKGAIDGLNTDFVGSIEKLGAFLSNGNGGLADRIGGFLGANSGAIANVAPYASSIVSLLSGDFKGAAFSAAGTALGSALGGPVGGAIGSVLGKAVGGLFGGSDLPKRTGGFVDTSLIDGVVTTSKKNRKDYDFNGVKSVQNALISSSNAFNSTLSSFTKMFGGTGNIASTAYYFGRDGGSSYKGFSGSIDGTDFNIGRTKGKFGNKDLQAYLNKITGEYLAKAIQSTGVPEAIKSLFAGLTTTDQVSAMINASGKLNDSQKQLADRFGLTLDSSVAVGKSLGLTGEALGAYLSQLGDAAYSFKSQSEIVEDAKTRLTKSFGADLPASIDDFDATIKAVDKTTDEGIKRVADLLNMRAEFIAYDQALKALNNTLVDSSTALGLINSNNYTDLASYQTAKAFAAQGLSATYNSNDATQNGKMMVSELVKLREAIAEVINNTKTTARVLLSVTDGQSLITS